MTREEVQELATQIYMLADGQILDDLWQTFFRLPSYFEKWCQNLKKCCFLTKKIGWKIQKYKFNKWRKRSKSSPWPGSWAWESSPAESLNKSMMIKEYLWRWPKILWLKKSQRSFLWNIHMVENRSTEEKKTLPLSYDVKLPDLWESPQASAQRPHGATTAPLTSWVQTKGWFWELVWYVLLISMFLLGCSYYV